MAKLELLIIVAFAALVCCTEIEDAEQKKRGAAKGTNLNSITTGAHKQDYTYNIYSSNPSTQTSSNSYQSQVPTSFYPNQGSNQYYTSSNTQTETPPYSPQHQQQINVLPATNSQFVPLNFVPNPGYQAKYHIVPTKSNGNIHLAIYQQPNSFPPSIVPFSPQLFSPHSANQVNPHQHFNMAPQSGHFNIAPNFQPLGGSLIGHPSTMLLLTPPNLNPSYNNLLYPAPLQNFYNYYPASTQSKVNPYIPQGTNEYDKLQNSVPQSIPKDDNDISYSSENTSQSDSSSSYKGTYSGSRNSYAKL